jgi:hypothetical protein
VAEAEMRLEAFAIWKNIGLYLRHSGYFPDRCKVSNSIVKFTYNVKYDKTGNSNFKNQEIKKKASAKQKLSSLSLSNWYEQVAYAK